MDEPKKGNTQKSSWNNMSQSNKKLIQLLFSLFMLCCEQVPSLTSPVIRLAMRDLICQTTSYLFKQPIHVSLAETESLLRPTDVFFFFFFSESHFILQKMLTQTV